MKININPKHELLRWGPIDGKLIYPDFFNVAFTKYSKHFYSWPDVLWLCYDEKIVAICDYPNLRASGKKNFNRFILDDRKLNKYYRAWQKDLKELLKFQKQIANKLSGYSDSQLVKAYQAWQKKYVDFWTIGELPEVANWGGEQILKEILSQLVSAEDFIYAFEKLAAPDQLSFYQKAELDLLKLKHLVSNKKLFTKRLADYQKNYFWILNNYHHSRVLSVAYFSKQLAGYSISQAQNKLKELSALPAEVRQEKAAIGKKYKLDKKVLKIASRLSFCVWWQDLRKYYIFLANHFIDLFLKEFAKRFNLKFDDLHYYNCQEILDLLEKGKKVSAAEIRTRRQNLIAHYSEKTNSLTYIVGPKAKQIIKKYMTVKAKANIKEFKGLVVSQGKTVRGRVKIITSVRDIGKLKKGEILVTPMTSPDYIMAIRRAGAIITDEGGMTCHAAIVSRELGIPCVVGTKIATKVLKDGNTVEVNTSQGKVKVI
jgi:phosphohistidine swiveling domain-containing protein